MASEDEVNSTPKFAGDKGMMPNEEPIQFDSTNASPDLQDVDCEKHGAGRESNPLPDLKRKLKSRHLQMIAIGRSRTPVPSGVLPDYQMLTRA